VKQKAYINVLSHKDGNKLGKRKYAKNIVKWAKKATRAAKKGRI
jgi:hypothetical protein